MNVFCVFLRAGATEKLIGVFADCISSRLFELRYLATNPLHNEQWIETRKVEIQSH